MAIRLARRDDDFAETHEINVTPFIDVMLVLLIIFMVAAPLATVDVPVNLPSASAEPAARPEKPIFMTLKADRSLRSTTRPSRAKPWRGARHGHRRGSTQRVLLRADQSLPYGEVMEVMNLLRGAGYLKVALVALEISERAVSVMTVDAVRTRSGPGTRRSGPWLRLSSRPCMSRLVASYLLLRPAPGDRAEAPVIDVAFMPAVNAPARRARSPTGRTDPAGRAVRSRTAPGRACDAARGRHRAGAAAGKGRAGAAARTDYRRLSR